MTTEQTEAAIREWVNRQLGGIRARIDVAIERGNVTVQDKLLYPAQMFSFSVAQWSDKRKLLDVGLREYLAKAWAVEPGRDFLDAVNRTLHSIDAGVDSLSIGTREGASEAVVCLNVLVEVHGRPLKSTSPFTVSRTEWETSPDEVLRRLTTWVHRCMQEAWTHLCFHDVFGWAWSTVNQGHHLPLRVETVDTGDEHVLVVNCEGFSEGFVVSSDSWLANHREKLTRELVEWAARASGDRRERLRAAEEAERARQRAIEEAGRARQRAVEEAGRARQRAAVREFLVARPKHVRVLREIHDRLVFVDEFGDVVEGDWRKKLAEYLREKLLPAGPFVEEVSSPDDPVQVLEVVLRELWRSTEGEEEPARDARQKGESKAAVGHSFEAACAKAFREAGYAVRHTGRTGDQGADLIATKDGKVTVVQCKCHEASLGNTAVQEAAAARDYYDAQGALVVSDGAFTKSARQLAGKLGVSLVAFTSLSHYLIEEK